MATLSWIKPLVLFLTFILPFGEAGQTGFIGYGISRWEPRCPYICRFTLGSDNLACSPPKGKTAPTCYASDDAFLHSLAWCIYSRCIDQGLWQHEEWWASAASGDPTVFPKYSFVDALPNAEPSSIVVMGEPLNVTSKTRDFDFQITWNTFEENENMETAGSRYALVLIFSGLLIPAAFALLRFVPLPRTLKVKVSAYLVLPATWGNKHRTPLANIAICPTRGQALYIFYLLILNLVFSFATYPSKLVPVELQTNYGSRKEQLLTIMANRLAVMCLANLALMILYAGRNNFLLWITKWQRETFLLFHHWIGYMVIVGAALHALIYLHLFVTGIAGDWSDEHTQLYWKFGTVAMISFTFIIPLSLLPIRVRLYEVFLATHRLLAALVLIGIFIHVYIQNGEKGFHNWIYAAFAAAGFDYFMRFLRIARNGVRMAKVTVIDKDYVRIDVPGPTAEGHAYVYFPSLTWRVWENHPFSVAASMHSGTFSNSGNLCNSGAVSPKHASPSNYSNEDNHGIGGLPFSTNKEVLTFDDSSRITSAPSTVNTMSSPIPTAGITFFIRQRGGLTSLLSSRTRIPVLIESSYGSLSSLSSHPNLIAIAGGVGIVTVLPLLRTHPGRNKLYWGLRHPSLLNALADDLERVDKEVLVGRRMDVKAVLEKEINGDRGRGAVVVVSGPSGLADEVRSAVCEIGKRKGTWPVRFVDESFG